MDTAGPPSMASRGADDGGDQGMTGRSCPVEGKVATCEVRSRLRLMEGRGCANPEGRDPELARSTPMSGCTVPMDTGSREGADGTTAQVLGTGSRPELRNDDVGMVGNSKTIDTILRTSKFLGSVP